MLRRYVDDDVCRAAMSTPPATTRAALRGAAIGLAQDLRADLAADWVNLRLDASSGGQEVPAIALRDPFATRDERVAKLMSSLNAMRRRSADALRVAVREVPL
ncbi:hypothetical protein ADENT20671_2566 [Actinomyces denticolens]|nr:hypothetical protein ADENT20671_2566 [Actinomyces denticolens]